MSTPHTVAIVGATSYLAEHAARSWSAAGVKRFVLVGRDQQRLDSIASDLRVRVDGLVADVVVTDLVDPQSIASTIASIEATGSVDTVLIAHGYMPPQADAQQDLLLAHETLEVTAVSPALWAEGFAGVFAERNRGTIAIIGSVAGDRGRKSNYLYGAAKGLLDRLAQGLSHRFAGSGVKVVLIKPGPTDTPMTADLKKSGGRLADAGKVAHAMVEAIDAGKPVAYIPGSWRVIMTVIQAIPRGVFAKLNI